MRIFGDAELLRLGEMVTPFHALTPMKPDNNNWLMCSERETPAEVMQWVKQRQARLRRELAKDARLWNCPEHRLTRTIADAIAKCTLWHHYGVRG